MTHAEAAQVVAILAEVTRHHRVTQDTILAYAAALKDIDFQLAKRAAQRLVNIGCEWLPIPSEIRRTCLELEYGARRTGAEAWGDVTRAIHEVGSYGYPEFKDQVVTECVRIMGWRNLALESSNDASDRSRFIELYDALTDRAWKDAQAGQDFALPPAVALPPLALRSLPKPPEPKRLLQARDSALQGLAAIEQEVPR